MQRKFQRIFSPAGLTGMYFLVLIWLSGVFGTSIGDSPSCLGVCNTANEFHPLLPYLFWGLVGWIIIVIIFMALGYPKVEPAIFQNERSLDNAILAICIGVFIWSSFYLWPFDLDDKWMLYRTSARVLEVGYPTWNLQERINLNTSLIWPYIISLTHYAERMTGQLEAWDNSIKIIGRVLLVAIACLFWFIHHKSIRAISIAAILLYVPLSLWSLGGIETLASCFWLALATWLFVKLGAGNPVSWFALAAAVLFRPELSLVAAGAFVPYFLFDKSSITSKFISGVSAAIPIAGYLAHNQLIFDDPLPTPAYAKVLQAKYEAGFDIFNNSVHFFSALVNSPLVLAFGALLVCALWRGRRLASPLLYLSVGLLVLIITTIGLGYKHMGFGFRYFLPHIVMMITLSGLAWELLVSTKPISEKNSSKFKVFGIPAKPFMVATVLVVSFPLSVFFSYYVKYNDFSMTRALHRDQFALMTYLGHTQLWMKHGVYLREHAKPTDRLWVKNAYNVAGGAISGLYSLDDFFVPRTRSYIKRLRSCHERTCYPYFDYVFLSPPLKPPAIPGVVFKEVFRTSNLVTYKNMTGARDVALKAK
jgi:hypothetical protein